MRAMIVQKCVAFFSFRQRFLKVIDRARDRARIRDKARDSRGLTRAPTADVLDAA